MTKDTYNKPVSGISFAHASGAMSKAAVRTKSLQLREALTEQERIRYSGEIMKSLTALACYKEAETVLAYVNYRSEVETLSLLEQALSEKKAVFVPRVEGKEMEFYQITGLDQLASGYRGILEPVTDSALPDYLAHKCTVRQASFVPAEKIPHILLCMPGTAFDRARRRIGYGGGFYDRYLEKLSRLKDQSRIHLTTAALAYSCQVWDEIPTQPHDKRPDFLLTQQYCIGESNMSVL